MIFGQKSSDDKLAVPAPDLDRRRSMESEERPLPEGWVRQWDANSQHHFYVSPSRSPLVTTADLDLIRLGRYSN